ncbi:hypothetical protein JCM1841_000291 [Sporobolomyces salmonicolor]
MGKLIGRIWVTGTLLLISFIGFTSQLCIVLPSYHYDYTDPELLKLLLPFNAFLSLLFWNYALCVSTDPGQVPRGWEPDWKEMESGELEVKKLTGGPRYCRTCRAYKPPRAHHCRQCKRCVLKMDHHCPWVNNCVGHHNYGHFVRFLFYVDVACSYHLWMVTKRAFGLSAFSRAPTTFQVVMLVLNYTACVPVIIAVGVFSLFHYWSILTNTTTIEGWEKDKAASLKRRGKVREYRYPYHLGYLANMQDVLGRSPLLWCWPQRASGTGLKYRVGAGVDPREQNLWPPRDEFAPARRKSRQPRPAGSPFTYGSGLNPDLLRSTPSATRAPTDEPVTPGVSTLRQRHGYERTSSPSAASSDDEGASSSSFPSTSSSPSVMLSDYGQEGDDDIPLGALAARRHAAPPAESDDEDLDPDRAVRIRHGSEGYEIRPRLPYGSAAARVGSLSDDGSWERLERDPPDPYHQEVISEGELDEDGDRRRLGPRYRYYVREEDSESDTEDERELGE